VIFFLVLSLFAALGNIFYVVFQVGPHPTSGSALKQRGATLCADLVLAAAQTYVLRIDMALNVVSMVRAPARHLFLHLTSFMPPKDDASLR